MTFSDVDIATKNMQALKEDIDGYKSYLSKLEELRKQRRVLVNQIGTSGKESKWIFFDKASGKFQVYDSSHELESTRTIGHQSAIELIPSGTVQISEWHSNKQNKIITFENTAPMLELRTKIHQYIDELTELKKDSEFNSLEGASNYFEAILFFLDRGSVQIEKARDLFVPIVKDESKYEVTQYTETIDILNAQISDSDNDIIERADNIKEIVANYVKTTEKDMEEKNIFELPLKEVEKQLEEKLEHHIKEKKHLQYPKLLLEKLARKVAAVVMWTANSRRLDQKLAAKATLNVGLEQYWKELQKNIDPKKFSEMNIRNQLKLQKKFQDTFKVIQEI